MTPEQLIGKTIEILHMAGGTPNSPSFPFQVGSKLVVKNCKMSGSDYVLLFEGTESFWYAALGHHFKICDLPSVPQVKSPRWGNLETTEEWKAPIVEIDTVPLIPPNPISNPAARQWTDYSFEEIWEEAKRRYPVGTKFTSVIDSRSYVVVSHETPGGTKDHWNKNKQVWFYADPNIPDFKANVFKRNIWAEIIEQPKPAEPDYDAILNKARADYPMRCSYKALIANGDVSDKIWEVTCRPNWVGEREELRIDGGIDYLYVKGKWAERVDVPAPTPEESLLDKAIRRYPIGTKVKTVNSFGFAGEETVTSTPRIIANDAIDWSSSNAYLYRCGRWAEIVTTASPTAPNRDDILTEAIRRYPIGTKVITVRPDRNPHREEVVNGTPRKYNDNLDKIDWQGSVAFLYYQGHWATIVQEVQTAEKPEVTSAEAILAEAIKRYPIGTKVRCVTGEEETVTDTPRLYPRRGDKSSAQIDWEDSKGFLYLPSHGNRWAEILSASKDPREALLDAARERYPEGSVVRCLTHGTWERIENVEGNKPKWQDHLRIRMGRHATRVYADGIWAIRDDSQTPDKGEESTESAQATSATNSQAQSAAAVQAITEKDPRTYTIEEALEECKRRYPPGTRVIPVHGHTKRLMPEHEFVMREGKPPKQFSSTCIDCGQFHEGHLYYDGYWAKVVGAQETVSEKSTNVELKISTPDNKMTGVKAEKIIETPLVEKKKHIYF